jgi:hypothetical protein
VIQHLVFRRSGPSSEAIGCQLSDGDALYLGAYYGTCNMRGRVRLCSDGRDPRSVHQRDVALLTPFLLI